MRTFSILGIVAALALAGCGGDSGPQEGTAPSQSGSDGLNRAPETSTHSGVVDQPAGREWLGKDVIQKAANFSLRMGNAATDTRRRVQIYHVEGVNGAVASAACGANRGLCPTVRGCARR